jgi:hypothetical protein
MNVHINNDKPDYKMTRWDIIFIVLNKIDLLHILFKTSLHIFTHYKLQKVIR